MKTKPDLENIERYLEGKMDEAEKAAFEKELAETDTDSKEDDNSTDAIHCDSTSDSNTTNDFTGHSETTANVNDYKAAVNAIKAYNRSLLRSRLRQIHDDVQIKRAAVRKLYRWYRAAALLALVAGVTVVMFYLIGKEEGSRQGEESRQVAVGSRQEEESRQEAVGSRQEEESRQEAVGSRQEEESRQEAGGSGQEEESRQEARGSRQGEESRQEAVDSRQGEKKVLAKAYLRNMKYESLIAGVYRGTAVRITTPDTAAVFAVTDSIVFCWEGEVDGDIMLKIIDNTENIVFETAPTETGRYVMRKRISPGLYYWMLETEEENHGYGRFVVR